MKSRLKKVNQFLKEHQHVYLIFILSRVYFGALELIHLSNIDITSKMVYNTDSLLEAMLTLRILIFDSGRYSTIAKFGYMVNTKNCVFFPLVPILVRYLGVAGFIILNSFSLLIIMYILDEHFKSYSRNSRILILYILTTSCISFYTDLLYGDTIFLLLTLIAFKLHFSKKHSSLRYFTEGSLIGLSVMCRAIGCIAFFMIFGYMCYQWFKKEVKIKDILLTYIPATGVSVLYPIYLCASVGDPLYFVHAYNKWTDKKFNLFSQLIAFARQLIHGGTTNDTLYDIYSENVIREIKPYGILYSWVSLLLVLLVIFLIQSVFRKGGREAVFLGATTVSYFLVVFCSSLREGNGALVVLTQSFHRYMLGSASFWLLFNPSMKRLNTVVLILSALWTIYGVRYFIICCGFY